MLKQITYSIVKKISHTNKVVNLYILKEKILKHRDAGNYLKRL